MPTPTKGQENFEKAVENPKKLFTALVNAGKEVFKEPTNQPSWCGTPKEEKEQPSCWEPKGRK